MYAIIDSVFPMLMDVYKQFDTQDESTGALKKEWQFTRTLPCSAKGTVSNSSSRTSGDKQVFGNKYLNDQVLQVRTATKVTFREKITNIRNLDGTVIWEEINFPNMNEDSLLEKYPHLKKYDDYWKKIHIIDF